MVKDKRIIGNSVPTSYLINNIVSTSADCPLSSRLFIGVLSTSVLHFDDKVFALIQLQLLYPNLQRYQFNIGMF